MYIPASFAETDVSKLHALMRAHNFATLVSNGTPAPYATPLPFLIDEHRGSQGTLVGHMARANPHWKSLSPDQDVLVIFQGAHSYISPRWYAPPSVVPTWNYAMVQATGKPCLIHEPDALRHLVTALVDFHEGPGGLDDIDAAFPDALLKAIVGIEIPIDRLEGKFKMSQNKAPEDQQGVIAALEQSSRDDAQAVAQIMRTYTK